MFYLFDCNLSRLFWVTVGLTLAEMNEWRRVRD